MKKEERKHSYREAAKQINKKEYSEACPICDEKRITIKNIDEFIQMNKKWLT